MDLNVLKGLYREGFDDSDAYIDFFFEKVVRNGNVLTCEKDGEIVSAGYIVEKPAFVLGKTMNAAYLSALSTLKSKRGKGYIGDVIADAFTALRGRGHSFVLLNPFNPDYYKRYGFSDVAFCTDEVIGGGDAFQIRALSDADSPQAKNIYAQMMSSFDNRLLLTDDALALKLNEYAVDSTEGFMLSENGVDFAFGFIEDGAIPFYATTDIARFKKTDALRGLRFKSFSGADTYVQARIIDVRKVLTGYPYRKDLNINLKIGIIDRHIKDNNIICSLKVQNGGATLTDAASADTVIDISALTSSVFCGDGLLFKSARNCFIDKY